MRIPILILFATTRGVGVEGGCHNQCSGQGTCDLFGQCNCWDSFEGWDCSRRVCPSGTAWADVPSGEDTAHGQALCSNMGYCDSATGQCVCQEGFEGPACERMKCPNDCSGHGQCISMSSAASTNDGYRLNRTTSYLGWDADMIYGCICDDGYDGYDCSQRPCPVSDSGLTGGQQDETVLLYCRCADCSGTFRVRYKGVHATLTPHMSEAAIAESLMALSTIKGDASEYLTQPISVNFTSGEASVCSSGGTTSTITFKRDPGDLPPLYLRFNKLNSTSGGAVDLHMTTEMTLLCSCRTSCGGFFRLVADGEVTDKIPFDADGDLIKARLSEMTSLTSANLTIIQDNGAACADSSTSNTSITIQMPYGNYPLQVIHSLLDADTPGGEMYLITNDGTKEQEYCAGLGTCSFLTGECDCDEDYEYDQEYGPCGQYAFTASHWPGRQKCPGLVERRTLNILPTEQTAFQLYFSDEGLNATVNDTYVTFSSTVGSSGIFWYNEVDGEPLKRVPFSNVSNNTITNAFALDLTYRVLYWGEGSQARGGTQEH
ncbi:unnamed protein product [Discosporangium mesarthrocarpum]